MKQEVREIIGKYVVNDYLSDPDREAVSLLCGYEFQWVQRIYPKMGGGVAIRVQCDDESHIGPWSWVKSIDGYSHEKNIMQAMRSASRLGTFRSVALERCNNCGSLDNLSVDHKTIPFVAITSQYVELHGQPNIVHTGNAWELVNVSQFLTFHDSLADYQVLCRSCNSSKGSKGVGS